MRYFLLFNARPF